jgi:hypothetical protein
LAYPEVLIPPGVRPVSPTEPQFIDDQTTVFVPRFGRGYSQRQTWGDPMWGWKVRFEGLSQSDRAALRRVVVGARGKAANIRMTPGLPLRGSFPATELLTNNDFSNGTTGWSGGGSWALSSTDRIARATRTANTGAGNPILTSSPLTITQYAPYVLRYFISGSSEAFSSGHQPTYSAVTNIGTASLTSGMATGSVVRSETSVYPAISLFDTDKSAGTFIDVSWFSHSRCALVDNGPNALTYSDQFDNAAWVKSNTSVTANSTVSPDGTTTADTITASNSSHSISQGYTVSSAAADQACAFRVKAGSQSWVSIGMTDNVLGNVSVFVNLSTGAQGTLSAGTGWSNGRAFICNDGNGWYRVALVARKTGASTSIAAVAQVASADNTLAASGTIYLWRGGAFPSSVPFRPAQTTTTATTGTAQTGSRLYLKGLPASTSGLLLAGDFFEINGELKQCTASLDSDAAGLGLVQFGPGMAVSPADNDPVIILNPMGRFTFAGDPRISERFGVYTDVEMDLVESYS